MTSDPKHLPPRDCLVLLERRYDWEEPQPIWQHVIFMEHDDSGHSEGDGPWWRIPESTETIDPSRVITWRELPEVE